ncbi:MAG: hypothetical protein ABL901_01865 [Hyphomicrobiaceae bacterium]
MPILRMSLIVAACISLSLPATAGGRQREGFDNGDGVVIAHSKWGNGTVSGPVRYTSVGRQVRLPGGTWEHCKRSCTETLRVATVDFWEAKNGLGAECGIFGCLEIRYPR